MEIETREFLKRITHIADYLYAVQKENRAYHDFRVSFDTAMGMLNLRCISEMKAIDQVRNAQQAYNKKLRIKESEKQEEIPEIDYYDLTGGPW